jgi:hypothetical protein
MSDTPETDHLEDQLGSAARLSHPIIWKHARQLERERDEVKAKYDILAVENMLEVNKLCKERDEVRDAFKIVYNERVQMELERNEWKNKAYSHATDYTLMEAKCFRLEQELKEIHSNQSVIIKHYDKLKS